MTTPRFAVDALLELDEIEVDVATPEGSPEGSRDAEVADDHRRPEPTPAEPVDVDDPDDVQGEVDDAGPDVLTIRPPAALAPEGHYGVAGEWWSAIEPQSEASAAPVIATLYTLFGNTVGRDAHFDLGVSGAQRANENVLVVGRTNGAKGDSLSAARLPFEDAATEWLRDCMYHAANSTAGVIDVVRDPVEANAAVGTAADPGCLDPQRRAMFTLTEFASLVKKFETRGDTLSSTLRDAWDGVTLQNTSKSNRARATNYHISCVAHVTPREFRATVSDIDAVNGFVNRFLIIHSERSKDVPIPAPPDPVAVAYVVRMLRDAIVSARHVGAVGFDDEAETIWRAVYPTLVALPDGRLGAVLARGRSHVLRLALISALLDRSSSIRAPHLLAAIALWDYAAASAAWTFPEGTSSTVRRLLDAVQQAGGRATAREVYAATNNHLRSDELHTAAKALVAAGVLRVETIATGGRPKTEYVATGQGRWSPVPPVLPLARDALARVRGDQ